MALRSISDSQGQAEFLIEPRCTACGLPARLLTKDEARRIAARPNYHPRCAFNGDANCRLTRTTEDNMRAALVLGVVATLALSAGAASAQEAVYPRHGYAPHGYGYPYGYHHLHYGYHHRHARYRY